ncbi:hypothetical protein H0H87_005155 [Tephrocybe sp. NHM501043]|nr:hypothetical protein H0H87_005155 [Tephrocybe sp. NHM501043]
MDDAYEVLTTTQTHPSFDLKANGEVSRMRNHKGNVPVLPQTKYCPLCPAKFTRTTHLNRHMRSHTNERLHRCNTCEAEFTRSDLLTRHKRTCGDKLVPSLPSGQPAFIHCIDSSNANRSRRKSCQACAESKVKCNLEQPCAKCTSRGHECVFINDPEASRTKKLAAASKRKRSQSDSALLYSADRVASSISQSVVSSPTEFSSPVFMPFFETTSTATASDDTADMSVVPALSASPGSPFTPESSSHSSPLPEFFNGQTDIISASTTPVTFDILPLHAYSLDPFLNGAFSETEAQYEYFDPETTQSTNVVDFSWNEFCPRYGDPSDLGNDQLMFSQPEIRGYGDTMTFIADHAASMSTENNWLLVEQSPRMPSALEDSTYDSVSNVSHGTPRSINSADLDLYLNLFFSAFCVQIPLVHIATWSMQDKPLILVRAMQACGALFVRTPAAAEFIDETLTSTRDVWILEFAKLSSDPREQNNLLLAVALLQTIGLFHEKADQRISSNVYHGMLVEPAELDICLPCDDGLWSACDSEEWYGIALDPSPYGFGCPRILGFPMQTALAALRQTRLSTVTLVLNPFAQFILIHTILRNLFVSHAESPNADGSIAQLAGTAPLTTTSEGSCDHAFATQYALHHWLQIWLGSPESMDGEESQEEPQFIQNALPFYWLAQVSLIALRDASAIFDVKSSDPRDQRRFRLMKEWLYRIRGAMQSGNAAPTHLWDELMKIQPQAVLESDMGTNHDSDGLLAFFSSKL